MKTLWLRIRAPFAAFRWMQAGVWRATSPVIPHSAAWGLALNLAGIETRRGEKGATASTAPSAPRLQITVGQVSPAGKAVLYQQLHSYPVGNSGKELSARAHGCKYWITPVRREVLIDLDCVVGIRVDQSANLFDRISMGLAGSLDQERYGLPFAGDNNLMIDSIDVLPEPPPTCWYSLMDRDAEAVKGSCRLTVDIDRTDSSKTRALLFAPTGPLLQPPESAWILVPKAP